VHVKHQYEPLNFTIDSGFVTGSLLFCFWLYFMIFENPVSYTWLNTLYSFLGSILLMLWGIVGLNSMVKGL
jgi:hypothetical protein